jgi:hypothetical protein
MTLTIVDCEQRTPEWFAARAGIVTASQVGKLLTPTLKVADNDTARGIIAGLVAERITGEVEPSYLNDDMARGVLAEPVARDLYSGHFEQAVEVGFYRLENRAWTLGASPDGLVGTSGGLEIKAPRAKGHVMTILADKVPAAYMAQIQACLLVTSRDWWDYCSYHAGLPLFVKRVYPDPEWFEAIRLACIRFEQRAAEMVADYEKRTARMPKTERIDYGMEMVL